MKELLKRQFDMFVKHTWLKIINKECDRYNKLKSDLASQQFVVNVLIERYKEIYGEDLRKVNMEK